MSELREAARDAELFLRDVNLGGGTKQICLRHADALRQALTKEVESGWVSVEDALPAVGQVVLGARESIMPGTWDMRVVQWYDNKFSFPMSDQTARNIVLWQPLPTPPQQQGEGGE